MSSSDPRSISSGLSLPQWMKRIENRFDIDGTPFSPPAHDDSFFYVRYPVASNADASTTTNVNLLSTVVQSIDEPKITTVVTAKPSVQPQFPQSKSMAFVPAGTSGIDFSKHPESCRKFIGDKASSAVPTTVKGQTKSQGTDDGFKDAVCSSSILKVAQQVIAGRQFTRGFTVANFDEVNVDPEETLKESEDSHMSATARSMMRRGSKSLPASPLGSPKTVRKNPYFTGTYTTITAGDTEKRGWLLSSLLGIQREATTSTSTSSVASQIEEEPEDFETNNNITSTFSSKKPAAKPVLKAKPSELREMNFWSPTSM